jgi:osmotically-inducible protein OsmY
MKYLIQKGLATLGAVTLFASFMVAQTASITRYDTAIQQNVVKKLGDKKEFRNVRASVEDGIVTLAGTVDVYQQKLDAARKVAKVDHAAGVRNLIEVAGPDVSDAQLEAKLSEKLRYDRIGYDNLFNFFTLGIKG